MAFIDELNITAQAGKGGDGVVRWLHLKGKELGGPSGGNGGNGGSVYVRAVRDIGALARYRSTPEFFAEHGGEGMKNSMYGKNGEDLFIELPIGSIVTNRQTGKLFELLVEGEERLILQGGRGGLGNEHFKSSRNVNPKEWTLGKEGESGSFHIELALIADAGFIGFPNAGKSSLLNALTRARAKVANYQFTTLDPNLGEFFGFILADIPGLIEGASTGKGLGYKFLKHITRTKLLIHCISLESDDVVRDYRVIRKELVAYDAALADKQEIVILTNSDTVSQAIATNQKNMLAKETDSPIYTLSVLDDALLKEFSDTLAQTLNSF